MLAPLKAAAEVSDAPLFFWAGFLSAIYAYAGASIGASRLDEVRELIHHVAKETVALREGTMQ